MFRTQFRDIQLSFGTGSFDINSDDIPQGTANLWLTPVAQTVSGSKTFIDPIFVASSGSIFNTLTTVGNLHAGGDLHTAGDLYIDTNRDTGKAGMYIRNDFATFIFNGSTIRFEANKELHVTGMFTATTHINGEGQIRANDYIITNYDGNSASEDAYIRFCGNGVSKTLTWDYAAGRFDFNDKLNVSNIITCGTSGSQLNSTQINGNLLTTGIGIFNTIQANSSGSILPTARITGNLQVDNKIISEQTRFGRMLFNQSTAQTTFDTDAAYLFVYTVLALAGSGIDTKVAVRTSFYKRPEDKFVKFKLQGKYAGSPIASYATGYVGVLSQNSTGFSSVEATYTISIDVSALTSGTWYEIRLDITVNPALIGGTDYTYVRGVSIFTETF